MDNDDDEKEIRPPDVPFMDRLVDNGLPYLSIDEELEVLRTLHNSDNKERKKIKKILKEKKIMESIEKNIKYEEDTIFNNNNNYDNNYNNHNNDNDKYNKFPDDRDLENILRQSEDEFLMEQMQLIEEFEREGNLKKFKLLEHKHNELDNLIKKISNIVVFNNIKNDDNIFLEILNSYVENYEEILFLDQDQFVFMCKYLKKNYEDLKILKKKTFLTDIEYEFLKSKIAIK